METEQCLCGDGCAAEQIHAAPTQRRAGIGLIGDLRPALVGIGEIGHRVVVVHEHGQVVQHLLLLQVVHRRGLADAVLPQLDVEVHPEAAHKMHPRIKQWRVIMAWPMPQRGMDGCDPFAPVVRKNGETRRGQNGSQNAVPTVVSAVRAKRVHGIGVDRQEVRQAAAS